MYTYPRPRNLAYPDGVLSDEGSLSRGDPSADRARAGRTGAPRNGRCPGGRWSAGRRCALPWARAVPCRARWVHHPPQGCPLVPWRLPPLHPLARFARDWQTSDALRRENAEGWLFESMNQKLKRSAFLTSPRSFAGRGRREAPGEGPGTALARSKAYRVGTASTQQERPESLSRVFGALPRPSPEAFAALRLRPLPARAGRG